MLVVIFGLYFGSFLTKVDPVKVVYANNSHPVYVPKKEVKIVAKSVHEAQTSPVRAKMPLSELEQLIVDTWPEDPETALAVAYAESMLNSNAHNPEWHKNCQGSYGVFQIACVHEVNPSVLYDAKYNIKRAREIYDAHGWQPWGAYTDKRYKQFLAMN